MADIMESLYNGKDRREYCAAHSDMVAITKKAVPRWAFISALGGVMSIAILFMGINEARLSDIKELLDSNAKQTERAISRIEYGVEKRISIQQERYREEVHRFTMIAEKNGDKLDKVSGEQAEIKALQNLVLKKIKITE